MEEEDSNNIHAFLKREYLCISTVGISPSDVNDTDDTLASLPSSVPNDACWGQFVSEARNVVYMNNSTACLINLPPDLRKAILQRMIEEFTDNPINCHVQFAYNDGESNVLALLFVVLLFVSMVSLLLTIVVYGVKGELKTVPGLSLACLSVSHLVHYLTGVLNLFNFPHYLASNAACSFFGFARNFSILATFFWLNVMAFDIWRTVVSMRVNGGRKTIKSRRFLKYSLYAWGTSLFVACWAIAFDNIPHMPESWRPNYRRPYLLNPDVRCAMSGNNMGSLLLFNTLPRLIVLVANCVFFFLTARTIQQTNAQVAAMGSMTSQRARFRLYIKLFIVMGLAWTLNIIDYIVHLHYGVDWVLSGPDWFKKLVDYTTAVIGIAIFLTFALMPMISYIREKCCCQQPVQNNSRGTKRTSLGASSTAALTRFSPRTKALSSVSSTITLEPK